MQRTVCFNICIDVSSLDDFVMGAFNNGITKIVDDRAHLDYLHVYDFFSTEPHSRLYGDKKHVGINIRFHLLILLADMPA